MRPKEERRARRARIRRGELPRLQAPGWLGDLLVKAACEGYCVKVFCTTCAAGSFREELSEGLEAAVGRLFTYTPNICHLELDDEALQVLVDELLIVRPTVRAIEGIVPTSMEGTVVGYGERGWDGGAALAEVGGESRAVDDDRFSAHDWCSALSLAVHIAERGVWPRERLHEALAGSVYAQSWGSGWLATSLGRDVDFETRRAAAKSRLEARYARRIEEQGGRRVRPRC